MESDESYWNINNSKGNAKKGMLPVSVELLMVLFAVEMADWLVTGVPAVVAAVFEELLGERAALAACACACACC